MLKQYLFCTLVLLINWTFGAANCKAEVQPPPSRILVDEPKLCMPMAKGSITFAMKLVAETRAQYMIMDNACILLGTFYAPACAYPYGVEDHFLRWVLVMDKGQSDSPLRARNTLNILGLENPSDLEISTPRCPFLALISLLVVKLS